MVKKLKNVVVEIGEKRAKEAEDFRICGAKFCLRPFGSVGASAVGTTTVLSTDRWRSQVQTRNATLESKPSLKEVTPRWAKY